MTKKEQRDFERKYNVKIDRCIKSTHPIYGRMLNYIIKEGHEAAIKVDDFSQYRAYYAYAYVENVDHPELSECGEIGLAYDKVFDTYVRIW